LCLENNFPGLYQSQQKYSVHPPPPIAALTLGSTLPLCNLTIVVPHENDLGSEMVSLVSNRFSTLFHIHFVFLVNSETTP